MSARGFSVTKHYLGFDTAWRAEFTHGSGGRVIGLQSEMDALPNIGHACGHNLIAISGVATALGLKAALEHHSVDGKIILLGTPGTCHLFQVSITIGWRVLTKPRTALQLRSTVVERSSYWNAVLTKKWTSV